MLSHGVVGGIPLIRRDSVELSRDSRVPAPSSWTNHWGVCAHGTKGGVLPLKWRKVLIAKCDERRVGSKAGGVSLALAGGHISDLLKSWFS